MKSFKLAIITAILALGIAAPVASAQDDAPAKKGRQGQSQRGGGADFTAELLKGITLTKEQQQKVDKIKADVRTKISALSQEDRRAKTPEIMAEARKNLRDVLTAEQKKTFDENVKARGKGGEGKGKGGEGKGKGKGEGKGKKKGGGGDE